jgi:hypothetical protein
MIKKMHLLLVLLTVLIYHPLSAQSGDTPVEHMNYFTNKEEELSKSYLTYMSEVAHGERARKMERRRLDLINLIKETLKEAARVRPYKADASLRNAYTEYWNISLSIFNEDYHKIVDMEEVAEQSYDAMEAYLLAQDKATEKLSEAYDKVEVSFKAFAAAHEVKLVESPGTKLSKKMHQAGLVNAYYKVIYLIFFKASVQEMYVMDAIKKKDVNGLEQSRGSLAKYAEEGISKLDTLKTFKGDGSLITATKKVLDFYKREASNDLPIFADFMIKSDEFEKIKKSFDAKPQGKRTQADVDGYNKAINDFNKAVVTYNKISETSNNTRSSVINNWNISKKRFMDAHVPYK